MIIDHIQNSTFYFSLSSRFAAGFEFLKSLDFESLQAGRNDLDGEFLYALKQEYQTRLPEDGIWEAHRRYADIQFIVEGAERVGFAPLNSMEIQETYNSGNDCAIFDGRGDFFQLSQGQFAIFFPHDVHRPCIAITEPSFVKKIVIKVLL